MTKYVDAGADTAASGKKKMRKGFKSDRLDNYRRMLAKKNGKKVSDAPTRVARPKTVMFDDSSRRDYLLSLHKKKNERRVQAFVDAKRKQRKDSAKTRREQREDARRAYNSYARVPILPDYTYRLPKPQDDRFDDDDVEEQGVGGYSSQGEEGEQEVDNPEAAVNSDGDKMKAEASQKRRRAKRLATLPLSAHAMPGAMLDQVASASTETRRSAGPSSSGKVDSECVTVEVKPLFGISSGDATSTRKDGVASSKALPSNNFDDLPLVVQQELRRLRQETKGPAKTKPRVHMMKELEKIRKIRKHSRKGHGKRKASGKRKNRK